MEAVVITAHNQKTYRVENVDGIEVHYLPVSYDNKFGFIARSASFLQYAWKSASLAKSMSDVDICYAMSVPLTVGLAAVWIQQRHKIPFLFEVGDLWPDAPVQMGFVRSYFLRQFLFGMERSFYKKAASIVALSPGIQSAIEGKIQGKTIHLIPNMADIEFYRPATKDARLERKFGTEAKFVVAYLGAVGVANGLDYFLECANVSRKSGLPIQFLLCGEGGVLNRLKASANRLGLPNLTFIDFQKRKGVREVLNVTDAVFVCYKNVPILETGSPNKFFDGLAAGKLIVINFGGWIKQEIEENRCGIWVDPRQPQDFVRKIQPFLEDPGLLKQFQNAARQLGEKKYSRDLLTGKFVNLFSTQIQATDLSDEALT
jgi:glycosyltransferase involved in cell wall biosynthesis